MNILLNDGTRILDDYSREYPLSIDLKITDKCKNECPWCHESSKKDGKSGDTNLIIRRLSELPEGTEIAIGGGNPLEYPNLDSLLSGLSDLGLILNMTLRDKDLPESINENITALGVSITPGYRVKNIPGKNQVCHLILGINDISDYNWAKTKFSRILWLGLKIYGRNINSSLPDIHEINREITRDLYSGDITLAFDNLAVSQLCLKNKFIKEEWDLYYQGPDFSTSMYIDAVKGEYGRSSYSPDRVSWDKMTIKEYYAKID